MPRSAPERPVARRSVARLWAVPLLVVLTATAPSGPLVLTADVPTTVAVSWADGSVDVVVPTGGASVDLARGLVLVERPGTGEIPSCDAAIVEISAESAEEDGTTTPLAAAALVDVSDGPVHCHLG